MKRIILLPTLLLAGAALLHAQETAKIADGTKMKRSGDYMNIDMDLNLGQADVESNRALLIVPVLVNGNDSLQLDAIGIYGRRRYYHYLRNGNMLTDTQHTYRSNDCPDILPYHALVPYSKWMDGAVLTVRQETYGCCGDVLGENAETAGKFRDLTAYMPELVYVQPAAAAVKSGSISGSANIDFPANRAEIRPDYHNNTSELEKIRHTIDSVRNDNGIIITEVWLKGYASPESPYAYNEKLAIGRTASLKQYIGQLYHFEDDIINTDHEAEDWKGLRRYVDVSTLTHRTEILAIIDSDMDLDQKEAKIKKTYPADYKHLLQYCYPALRHTDYRISYNIKTYIDAEEIRRLMRTQPQKLSLQEFYVAATGLEPGSDEYNEVFNTAVRMYPNDPTANLNAANAAMGIRDTESAARYLEKAGDTPQATYARGVLATLKGDYKNAVSLLRKAQNEGVKEAATSADFLQEALDAQNN